MSESYFEKIVFVGPEDDLRRIFDAFDRAQKFIDSEEFQMEIVQQRANRVIVDEDDPFEGFYEEKGHEQCTFNDIWIEAIGASDLDIVIYEGRFTRWKLRHDGLWTCFSGGRCGGSCPEAIAIITHTFPSVKAYTLFIEDLYYDPAFTDDFERRYFKRFMLTTHEDEELDDRIKEEHPGGFDSMDDIVKFLNKVTGREAISIDEYDWSDCKLDDQEYTIIEVGFCER